MAEGKEALGSGRLRRTHLVDENTTSLLFGRLLYRLVLVLVSVIFYHRTRKYDSRLAYRRFARDFEPIVISRKTTGSN
jgi:hypothetical protein